MACRTLRVCTYTLTIYPGYSQDFDASYPAEATRLKQDVESADALQFVTPEYSRSVPGVLKNALDIGSRPWGTNS
jgi:chromate reductase, NAD(P)H dehydrogenase (quinone)